MELLGALILARLANAIETALARKIVMIYWVDSMTTLFWIKRDKPWKQYVANRVREVHQLTNKDHWRHCPGHLNPPDLPSRGPSGDKLLDNHLWWEGPPFLVLPENEWPSEVQSNVNDIACQEIVKNPPEPTHVLTIHHNPVPNLGAVVDCNRYSSLTRLLRVTAYVFQFVKVFSQLSFGGQSICCD